MQDFLQQLRRWPPAVFALGLAAVLALAVPAGVVRGQEALHVVSMEATNKFPDGITFQLSAQSEADVTRVLLRYSVAPDGAAAFGEPSFERGRQINVTYDLQTGSRLYLPPGAEITWHWEVNDDSGRRLETEKRTIIYEDKRYQWQTLQDGNLMVKYYSGGEARAREMLRIGRETIDRMSRLEGVQVGFPVKMYIYASQRDGQAAIQERSRAFNEVIETGGVRVASDTVLIFDPDPDVIRHELAHVVTRVAGEGPFGDVPAWLNEGLSVYAQRSPGPYEQAVDLAVRRNRPLSLRSISSAPGDPALVNLFYGQSGSVVKYLIDTHGEGKLAQLLATFKQGARTDDAFRQVYGQDLTGIENGWRQSVGLQPREPGAPDDTSSQSQPVPTIEPLGSQGQQGAQPQPAGGQGETRTDSGGSGLPVLPILIIAFLTLALAGLVFGGGWYLLRRYR